jgi:uncharacterized membrane protein
MRARSFLLPALAVLSACGSHGVGNDASVKEGAAHSYAGIAAGETLHFTGTEPFWGGSVTGTALTYTTPENPKGSAVEVRRFAGNNGLAFSGELGGRAFDMAVTEARCSDGMSDRTYPFTVTLQVAGESRNGCGWTETRKFTGSEN